MSTTVMPETPQTPATPDAPAPAPELKSVNDVMASLLSPDPKYESEKEPEVLIVPEAAPDGAAPQATDLEEVPGDGASTTTAPATEEGTDAPAETTDDQPPPEFSAPDGSVFKVKGPDGKYTNIPDGLGHIEFAVRTPNGDTKTYVKSPAEIVAMARRAVGSEQVVQRVKAEAEDAFTTVQSFTELMREVFLDESGEKWQQRREEFLQMTGPEARAERAETELRTIKQQEATEAAQAHALTWYQTTVQPALDTAWKGTPDVSDEAKFGKINLLTAHLLENGVVPPAKRDEFASIVAGPFKEWATAEQARLAGLKAGAQGKQEEAAAAQRTAQAAVNKAARGIAPVGQAAPDQPVRVKPKNINEAMDFVTRRNPTR